MQWFEDSIWNQFPKIVNTLKNELYGTLLHWNFVYRNNHTTLQKVLWTKQYVQSDTVNAREN